MRIFEIASAEEQIELWKLVSNSVWQSLQQQQQEEKKRNAEAAAKKRAASKGVKGSARVGRVSSAMPAPMPAANQPPSAQQAAPTASSNSALQPNADQPLASGALSAASAQANAKKLPASALQKQLKTVEKAEVQLSTTQKKSDEKTDDRHSKNTRLLAASRSTQRR
jgi:hypothetical protein